MDHFTLLCDLFIFHIFDFLQLIDLASIGLTNKRLNGLANDYFNRKYSSKAISRINVDLYGHSVHPSLRAIQCFRNHFQIIEVIAQNIPTSSSTAQFLLSICGANVKSIDISPTMVKSNAELLNKMESVCFSWTESSFDCDKILADCQNVKHLSLRNLDSIPKNYHPKLKSFGYFPSSEQKVDAENKIMQFLQCNPQIRKYERLIRARASVEGELKIFENCVNIEEICVEFSFYHFVDVLKVLKSLKLLQERYNLKTLKIGLNLQGRIENSKTFVSSFAELCPILEAVTVMDSIPFYSVLANFPFENIKYLKIGFDIPESHAEQITKNLPNLEVLYTAYINLEIFKPFICRSKKLKKLFMRVDNVETDFLNSISSCIKQRKQLEGACKLTIGLIEDRKVVNKVIFKSGAIADVIIGTSPPGMQFQCKIGSIENWQYPIPIGDF